MAEIHSAQSGNWHDGNTWEGGNVPGINDRVVIDVGDEVQIDGDTEIGDSPTSETTPVVTIYGTLKWKIAPGADWLFNVKGSIYIKDSGRFAIGDAANPIPSTQKARLLFTSASVGYLIKLDGTTLVDANKPRFQIYGAENYHMSSGQFRARLSANAAQGATQIVVDRDVNWEAGDAICIGSGGSKVTALLVAGGRLSGYGSERVVIQSRIDARTYQLTSGLAYNHLAGDIVGHLTRNVVIEGTPGYGFCITKSMPSKTTDYTTTAHGFIDINWAQFKYCGIASSSYQYAVVYINGTSGAYLHLLTEDHYKFNYLAFDQAQSAPTVGSRSFVVANSAFVHTKSAFISNFVSFGISCFLDTSSTTGQFTLGKVVVINDGTVCINFYRGSIDCDALWRSTEDDTSSGATLYFDQSINARFNELLSCNGYNCFYCGSSFYDLYASFNSVTVLSGEILNCRRPTAVAGFYFTYLLIRNCVFAFYYTGVEISRECYFENCDFYGVITSSSGAVTFMQGDTVGAKVKFKNCRFGIPVQNERANITVNFTGMNLLWHIILEDCTFKVIKDYSAYNPILGQWLSVPISYQVTAGNWYSQANPPLAVVEFVRVRILDADDQEQLLTGDYAFVGGGAQIREETSEIIDGSFGIKMSPYNIFVSGAGTLAKPYKIPVAAGETLTVKISFKATQIHTDHADKRPAAHLFGCGINAVTYMSAIANSWTQVTVSGTANCAGLVDFWVTPGNGFFVSGEAAAPWTYCTVYVDGLIVEKTT